MAAHRGEGEPRHALRLHDRRAAFRLHWRWEAGRSRVLKELCSQVHLVTVIVYITLIAIHITAALKHLLVDRDGVF